MYSKVMHNVLHLSLLHIASAPDLYAVNFNSNETVLAKTLVNFTVQIISNLSLSRMATWSKKNADLPKDSYFMNYTKDGNNYTSLIINKVSYCSDGGVYYLNASNYCGSSSVSVVLDVYKGIIT